MVEAVNRPAGDEEHELPKLEEFGVLFRESVPEQLEVMNSLKHQLQGFF